MDIVPFVTSTNAPIAVNEELARLLVRSLGSSHKDKRVGLQAIEALLDPDYAQELHCRLPRLKEFIVGVRRNIDCIAMVVPVTAVEEISSQQVLIHAKPLSQRLLADNQKVCEGMPYIKQPSALGLGTAFFVKPGLLATAAHVVVSCRRDISDIRFVQGMHYDPSCHLTNGIVVNKGQVFKPVLSGALPASDYEYFSEGPDWALLQAAPAYPGAMPKQPISYPVLGQNPISPGDKLYSVGHGLMLPTKISGKGKVISFAHGRSFFECDLTLLVGNSGSPVFSAKDHKLVGLFMRGTRKLAMNLSTRCLEIQEHQHLLEGQECLCTGQASAFVKRLETFPVSI